jgi:predicted nucleotidyltransferase
MKTEFVKEVSKWGNSAGILLPRDWIGKQVEVILIDRTEEIREEVIDIVAKYLSDVIGIYLVGSYARNEMDDSSDIDVIVITGKTSKEIVSGKYTISLIKLDSVKKALAKNPLSVLPRLKEAKSLLNSSLLEELSKTKVDKKCFRRYILETKRILNINKMLLKEEGELIETPGIVYSLILRLRGLYLVSCLLSGKTGSKKEFIGTIRESIDEDANVLYDIYQSVKIDKKVKKQASKESVEKLLRLVEKWLKDNG